MEPYVTDIQDRLEVNTDLREREVLISFLHIFIHSLVNSDVSEEVISRNDEKLRQLVLNTVQTLKSIGELT